MSTWNNWTVDQIVWADWLGKSCEPCVILDKNDEDLMQKQKVLWLGDRNNRHSMLRESSIHNFATKFDKYYRRMKKTPQLNAVVNLIIEFAMESYDAVKSKKWDPIIWAKHNMQNIKKLSATGAFYTKLRAIHQKVNCSDNESDSDESETTQGVSTADGDEKSQKRQYYHSHTLEPVESGDDDSEAEAAPDWLKEYVTMNIEDFTDLNCGEKYIMNSWSVFMLKHPCPGAKNVFERCVDWLKSEGEEIVQKDYINNCLTHFTTLVQNEVLDANQFRQLSLLLKYIYCPSSSNSNKLMETVAEKVKCWQSVSSSKGQQQSARRRGRGRPKKIKSPTKLLNKRSISVRKGDDQERPSTSYQPQLLPSHIIAESPEPKRPRTQNDIKVFKSVVDSSKDSGYKMDNVTVEDGDGDGILSSQLPGVDHVITDQPVKHLLREERGKSQVGFESGLVQQAKEQIQEQCQRVNNSSDKDEQNMENASTGEIMDVDRSPNNNQKTENLLNSAENHIQDDQIGVVQKPSLNLRIRRRPHRLFVNQRMGWNVNLKSKVIANNRKLSNALSYVTKLKTEKDKENESLKQQHETEIAHLKKDFEITNAKLSESLANVSRVELENGRITNEMTSLKQSHTLESEQLKSQLEKNRNIRSKLEIRHLENVAQLNKKDQKLSQMEQMDSKNACLRNNLEMRHLEDVAQLNKKDQKLSQNEETKCENARLLDSLEKEMLDIFKSRTIIEETNEKLQTSVRELKDELQKVKAENFQRKHAQLETKVTQLQVEVAKNSEEKQSLLVENSKKNAELLAEIDKLLSNALTEVTKLKTEKERSHEAYNGILKENELLKHQHASKIEDLKKQSQVTQDKLNCQISALQAENESGIVEKNELIATIVSLKDELQTAVLKAESFQQQYAQLETKMTQLQVEVAKDSEDKESLLKEKAEAIIENSKKEAERLAEFDKLSHALTEVTKLKEGCHEAYNGLLREIELLKQQHARELEDLNKQSEVTKDELKMEKDEFYIAYNSLLQAKGESLKQQYVNEVEDLKKQLEVAKDKLGFQMAKDTAEKLAAIAENSRKEAEVAKLNSQISALQAGKESLIAEKNELKATLSRIPGRFNFWGNSFEEN